MTQKLLMRIYIEYGLDSPHFKQKAQEFFAALTEKFPEQKFKLVENRPRNGSFEIKIARNCRLPAKEFWSGIQREPREDKLPVDLDDILKGVRNFLK